MTKPHLFMPKGGRGLWMCHGWLSFGIGWTAVAAFEAMLQAEEVVRFRIRDSQEAHAAFLETQVERMLREGRDRSNDLLRPHDPPCRFV